MVSHHQLLVIYLSLVQMRLVTLDISKETLDAQQRVSLADLVNKNNKVASSATVAQQKRSSTTASARAEPRP